MDENSMEIVDKERLERIHMWWEGDKPNRITLHPRSIGNSSCVRPADPTTTAGKPKFVICKNRTNHPPNE